MLMQYAADRYRFHDLLGLYARRLLADDPESEPARARLHTWYAEKATAAMDWMYPQMVRLASHEDRAAFFGTEAEATAWLDAEVAALVAVVTHPADAALSWRITDQLRGYFLVRRHADGWLAAAEAGLAAAVRAGDDRARTAMLISRGQALWSAGRDEEALADCLAGERSAIEVGWTTAAAYLAHHVAWIHLEQGRLADAEERLRRALELTEDDKLSHVRAVAFNALGVMRLNQGELRDAADLLSAALEINEATGRETSALANRGNLASALRQLGAETEAAALLTDVLDAYRRGGNPRGELSTLDEWSELHRQRGDARTALETAEQAHGMAVKVNDPKATAQTAATVAHAHLALGDTTAAARWFEDCLTIAHDTYLFIEARALAGLATAQLAAGDAAAAGQSAKRAIAIAESCGYGRIEEEASSVLEALVVS
jgi:tetratricopeptide (TPR) repeat protein